MIRIRNQGFTPRSLLPHVPGPRAAQGTDWAAWSEKPARAALPGEECAQERAQQRREERAIDGQAEAQDPGEGEHPLAVASRGQELIDQVGGGVGHAPADAARAQSAFARERQELFMATARAPNAREAMAEQSAVEVSAKLSFNEPRIALAVKAAGPGEEGLEVLRVRPRTERRQHHPDRPIARDLADHAAQEDRGLRAAGLSAVAPLRCRTPGRGSAPVPATNRR
jgi:hypothetical protein